MNRKLFSASLLCAAAILAGCATNSNAQSGQKPRAHAVAVLSPAPNQQIKGQITFTEETQGVRVVADITGLSPGKHGFHLHEKGECNPPDFTSAGGHWNPTKAKHGAPTSGADHHYGDFGNIEANDKGVARFERTFNWLTFTGTNSFVGKAVVVHGNADDLTSQPAGNAGPRVACGVISRTDGK